MNADVKSADNSLKFYMRKKYLSTDHMEQGGNCCNGKMSLTFFITKWDFKPRKHRRESSRSLFAPSSNPGKSHC